MTKPVDVAVVTVTFNSSQVLPGLLESLPSGLEDLSWHLVVADNASADGSPDLAARLVPGCTIVELGRNAGYAAGLNAGVAAAPPHRAVLVLNPDVRLAPGCIAALWESLKRPGVGIVVPKLLGANGQLHYSMRREPSLLRALGDAVLGAARAGRLPALGEIVTDSGLYQAATYTDWAEGSTQLISSACWAACGPWDESFFLYSEETDFGLRARDAGYRTLLVPSAVATHLVGDSATSATLWPLLTANRVRLYWRRHGPAAGLLFWMLIVLREVTRTALGRATSRAALARLLSYRRMTERPGPETL